MDNSLKENEFFCPRCGRKMNNNMRYCMGCGYINPTHLENSNMVQYIEEKADYSNCNLNQEQQNQLNNLGMSCTYSVASEKVESFGLTNKYLFIFSLLFFIIILFFVIFLVGICLFKSMSFSSIIMVLIYYLPFFCFLGLFSFVFYSDGLFRLKLGIPWWTMFIPVYGQMVIAEKVFGNILYGLLALVPGINFIYAIILELEIANKFNISGIGLLFLPIIYYPIIIYGEHNFNETTYYSCDTIDKIKKEIVRNKFIFWMGFISIFGLIIMSIIYIFYLN